MNQIPPVLAKYMNQILVVSFMANLVIFVLLSVGPIPATEAQIRLFGGFFLMIFVCTHGWYRYGLNRMVLFFCITVAVTWSLETLSIAVGFPFGRFAYTDKLGEKIGVVPVMIFPAYFFTGYLAWSTAGILFDSRGAGLRKKHLVLLPLTGVEPQLRSDHVNPGRLLDLGVRRRLLRRPPDQFRRLAPDDVSLLPAVCVACRPLQNRRRSRKRFRILAADPIDVCRPGPALGPVRVQRQARAGNLPASGHHNRGGHVPAGPDQPDPAAQIQFAAKERLKIWSLAVFRQFF